MNVWNNTPLRQKVWEDYTPLEQAANLYSDAHKDAFGFRPRDGGVFNPQTLEEYEAAIDKCSDMIVEQLDEERRHCIATQRDFEGQIAEMLLLGATDRPAAIRWIFESWGASREELADPRYHTQDIESAAYGNLPIALWPFVLPEIIPGYRSH